GGDAIVAVAFDDHVGPIAELDVVVAVAELDVVVAVAGGDNGIDGQAVGELDVLIAALQEDINAGEGLAIRGLSVDAVERGLDLDAGVARIAVADRVDQDLVIGAVAPDAVELRADDRDAGA